MKRICCVLVYVTDALLFYFKNAALMSYRMGDFQDSYNLASKALKLHPHHVDSKELQTLLQKTFLNT
jgi:hypothetical protein